MMAQINRIWSEEVNKVSSAKQSVEVARKAIMELKQDIRSRPFASQEDEIYFFKAVKPKFHCRFLFYVKIYNLELGVPEGRKSDQAEHYKKELYKLRLFFESHTAFYHYYRSGETFLDERYFLRFNNESKAVHEFLYVDTDPTFSTIYDYQVAQILANELLSEYLNQALTRFDKDVITPGNVPPPLTWSDSKVALAELIYALHASGVFNNSQADIKTISLYISSMFNVKIGNIYKVFEEIRVRRKNRSAFLDFLRNNLVQRMDRDDEQAF